LWLATNRKKRYNVVFRTVSGEIATAYANKNSNWIKNLSEMLADFSSNDIFNVGEASLFCR